MDFFRPTTLDEALAIKAERPGAMPILGGTDVMVELNFDRHRPEALLDLTAVEGLTSIGPSPSDVDADDPAWDGADFPPAIAIGAGVTWTRIIEELGACTPGLAIASRTVGSPQIRNRGTLAGSLGSASPAGDGLPMLVASQATIEVASAARGMRLIEAGEWLLRPRLTALEPDELIVAVHTADRSCAPGAQQFAKIGTRNAMVIAVASFAIDIAIQEQHLGTGIGSAGPTVLTSPEAEQLVRRHLVSIGGWDDPAAAGPLDPDVVREFGELCAAAATPIDDVRGTAAYRTHAVGVMARRTLTWAWADLVRAHAASGAPA